MAINLIDLDQFRSFPRFLRSLDTQQTLDRTEQTLDSRYNGGGCSLVAFIVVIIIIIAGAPPLGDSSLSLACY
jgi:hypothetical protein